MSRLAKILIVLVLIVVALGLITYGSLHWFFPNVGSAPEMKLEATPERVERGSYLANHVSVCIDCHSDRDWSRFSGPVAEGTVGQGVKFLTGNSASRGYFIRKILLPPE